MKLDRLYALAKNGKIRVFDIEVIKGEDTGPCNITRSTGYFKGKMIKRSKVVMHGTNIGKANETTPLEQGILEAQSKWNEKKNEGYKSLYDIEKYLEYKEGALADIEENLDIVRVFQYLPSFNTNKDWYPLPMLAEPEKTAGKIEFPIYGQPKLNGVRCLMAWDQNGDIKLGSRGGKYYTINHLSDQVDTLLTILHDECGINPVLDGEIYKHGELLQRISGAAKKEDISIFSSDEWLEYHIYDLIDTDDLRADQFKRFQIFHTINDIIKEQNLTHIKLVRTRTLKNLEQYNSFVKDNLAQAYEGTILRRNEPYLISFRDRRLIKIKNFTDEEFEIIGCNTDSSKSIGESFTFKLKNNINDLTFSARPMGTEAMKNFWHSNMHVIEGKYATVRFHERSESGLPIQGHVRADQESILMEVIRDYE